MRKYFTGFALLAVMVMSLVGRAHADAVELADGHPNKHIVVKGDTLWDISSTFLKSPWQWPKVWAVNPQIDNPHLIFPGDTIYLVYVDGKPILRVERGPKKMSPQIRRSPLDDAIQSIPLDDIKSFLSDNLVLPLDKWESAPYVVGAQNDSIVAAAGDRIYARGYLPESESKYYGVYRPARTYKDPKTGEILGYESITIGSGYLSGESGDIISLDLKRTHQEVRIKDRVLPSVEEPIQSVFYPSAPEHLLSGQILSVLKGVSKIGQYDVVAINLGKREGLEPGHVLHVYKVGEKIKDPVTKEIISLPTEQRGIVMVFKVFDKVSYALVMEAQAALSVLDEVRTPE